MHPPHPVHCEIGANVSNDQKIQVNMQKQHEQTPFYCCLCSSAHGCAASCSRLLRQEHRPSVQARMQKRERSRITTLTKQYVRVSSESVSSEHESVG